MSELLILARGDECVAAYEQAFRRAGVVFHAARSTEEAFAIMRSTPLAGVVQDMPTVLRLQATDKQRLLDRMELFPVLRLRWQASERRLMAVGGRDVPAGEAIGRFLQECAAFTPRVIRRMERRECHLNVLLSPGSELERGHIMKTVTMNATPLGCFVFCTSWLEPGQRASLFVPRALERRSVLCRVAHVIPWGGRNHVPGAGLEFLDLEGARREEFAGLIGWKA
jgi:hypothetical protein